jgi:hypothetical protein
VQQGAGGGLDRDRERVGDRVVDGEELAVERAEPLRVLLGDLDGHRLDAVLLELRADQREREPRPDERDVGALPQQVGHGPDVVLVGVGEDERVDVVQPVPDRGEVREDQVDARLMVLREQDAAVDEQQPPLVLEDGHVPADLAETAEGDDPESARRQRRGRAEFRMQVAHAAVPARRASTSTPAAAQSSRS